MRRNCLPASALLRTILDVLDVDSSLLDEAPDSATTSGNQPKSREHDYLADLRSWVDNLDNCGTVGRHALCARSVELRPKSLADNGITVF